MNYRYTAYTEGRKIATGTIMAASKESADDILSHQGYRLLTLRPIKTLLPPLETLFPSLFQVKADAIVLFSRQIAMLLAAGTSIVTALELLQVQVSHRVFRKVLAMITTDLRSGSRFSEALARHPQVFPPIFHRALSVGEQAGELEQILREIADYLERESTTRKGVKSALSYPILVSVVAVVVVVILVNFVLPTFLGFYRALGAKLPLATRMLLAITDAFHSYGLYMFLVLVASAIGLALYIRTPKGKLWWHGLALKAPLIGKINHLNELSYCCRTMSVLFRSGLPPTEIMSVIIDGTSNEVIARSLKGIQQAMLKGEGLSYPMSKDPLFLPMMVQMVRVGEETGSLDVILLAVAETFDAEADNRTHALIGFIQHALTLFIGLVVAFVTIAMLSAMYTIYGQMGQK